MNVRTVQTRGHRSPSNATTLLVVLTILAGSFLMADPAWAVPPTNDNLENATVIADDFDTITYDNTDATLEGGEVSGTCENTTVDWSVWFRFNAEATGDVRFLTRMTAPNESNYIEVYEITSLAPTVLGTEVACLKGANVGTLVASVTMGQDYAIRVAGASSDLGDTGVDLDFDTMASISGTVTDEGTGLPLAGVSVNSIEEGGSSGLGSDVTAADGTYTLNVATAPLRISFAAAGYGTEWYDDATTKFGATAVGFDPATNAVITSIDAALSDSGSISGTVTSAAGGPIDDALVSLLTSANASVTNTRSAADGTYSFDTIPVGDYIIHVDDPGHLPEFYNDKATWDVADVLGVTAGSSTTNIDVELATGGTIEGTIIDDLGSPVEGVDVWATDSGVLSTLTRATTAADGTYSIPGIAPGSYGVFADASPLSGSHASEWWDDLAFDTAFGSVAKITVSSSSTDIANFDLNRTRLSGTVTSAGDGLAIEGVAVEVADKFGVVASTTTDASGDYDLVAFQFSGNVQVTMDPGSLPYLIYQSATTPIVPGTQAVLDRALDVDQMAPVVTANQEFFVDENASLNTAIGTVVATDANREDTVVLTIIGGNTGSALSMTLGGDLTNVAALDHETTPSFTLSVQADDDTTTSSADVIVWVNDVNEQPTVADTGGTVAEDVSVGTTAVTVSASDPDGDTLTYAITAGNIGSAFAIDTDGTITTATPLDYETTTNYTLTIEVADPDGLTDTATVLIAVTDVGGTLDVVVPPDTNSFDDDDTSIFENDIEWLAAAGITSGCGTRLFCPDDRVTRGQMAAFLARALNLPATDIDFFTDDDDSIFENDINRLAASGITSGCAADSYCPTGFVTRGQMAAFLNRAFGLPPTTTDFFTDDDDSIFENDINELAASGITSGCATDSYCPTGFVTRGQMAAFLKRAFN